MSRLVQFHLSTINPHSLRQQLSQIFADQPTVFKINLSFGFILQNTETRALQYHHLSANNNLVLEQPFLVSNQDDFELLYDQIRNIDSLEWVHQQRPSSKMGGGFDYEHHLVCLENPRSSHRPRKILAWVHCREPWNHPTR